MPASSLDQITIPSPCASDWETMIGNEQVRFCNHCQLSVHNLSAMTAREALKLVRRSNGRLCVRFHKLPDGSVRTSGPLTRSKHRASRLAAGAFGAALTLSAGATAQTPVSVLSSPNAAEHPAERNGAHPAVANSCCATLTGTVLDSQEAVIPGAKIILANKQTEQEESVSSNDEGVYRFESLREGNYTLTVQSTGFVTWQTDNIEVRAGGEIHVNVKLQVGGATNGMMVMVLPADPVVAAAQQNKPDKVAELLAKGADPNVVDPLTHTTALMEAVGRGNEEVVAALIRSGANVNLCNSNARAPLMEIDDETPIDIVRALLSAGARVEMQDNEGNTALTVAAGNDNAEIIRALIAAGADIEARNHDGKTALIIAAGEGNVNTVTALLAAGADYSKKDNDGETALGQAKENKHEEVISVLEAWGATG